MTIGVADVMAEDVGNDEDARENRERIKSEPPIDFEKDRGHNREQEEIIDHGYDAGGEQIIKGVHVGGDPGDQTSDRIAVEIAHRQSLQVRENSGTHVVHGLLADALHDADLNVLGKKVKNQNQQIADAHKNDTAPRGAFRQATFEGGREIVIDGPAKDDRRAQLQWSDDGYQRKREDDAPFVRPHVLHQAAHQARVVGFTECFFFVHVPHARSSSSSSNCFWYRSA